MLKLNSPTLPSNLDPFKRGAWKEADKIYKLLTLMNDFSLPFSTCYGIHPSLLTFMSCHCITPCTHTYSLAFICHQPVCEPPKERLVLTGAWNFLPASLLICLLDADEGGSCNHVTAMGLSGLWVRSNAVTWYHALWPHCLQTEIVIPIIVNQGLPVTFTLQNLGNLKKNNVGMMPLALKCCYLPVSLM